ncbi:MAG: hypothetical protein K0R15_2617 [Clostridiales bacterium]|jgi:CRP-like cAMP-binding protein|nr:hypothetical protein [Clostridiales bacterium]
MKVGVSMEQYIDIIMKCPLFNDINKEELLHLINCLNVRVKSYKSDEYVFLTGDEVNYIIIILSGSIEALKENLAGNRHIIALLEPSDLFGEGIVCTKKRISPISTRAKENSTLLFIPYEKVTISCGNACTFHNHLVRNMMLLLGEKNYILNKKMDLLMLKGMREKLASYLLNETHIHKALTFNITLNRTELAEYLNVSRTSMCRELGRMQDEGIIDYYQNSFKIISPSLLKECLAN